MDENGDGTISKIELKKAFKQFIGVDIEMNTVEKILNGIDSNKNG